MSRPVHYRGIFEGSLSCAAIPARPENDLENRPSGGTLALKRKRRRTSGQHAATQQIPVVCPLLYTSMDDVMNIDEP
jgi:hypothetical protein